MRFAPQYHNALEATAAHAASTGVRLYLTGIAADSLDAIAGAAQFDSVSEAGVHRQQGPVGFSLVHRANCQGQLARAVHLQDPAIDVIGGHDQVAQGQQTRPRLAARGDAARQVFEQQPAGRILHVEYEIGEAGLKASVFARFQRRFVVVNPVKFEAVIDEFVEVIRSFVTSPRDVGDPQFFVAGLVRVEVLKDFVDGAIAREDRLQGAPGKVARCDYGAGKSVQAVWPVAHDGDATSGLHVPDSIGSGEQDNAGSEHQRGSGLMFPSILRFDGKFVSPIRPCAVSAIFGAALVLRASCLIGSRSSLAPPGR